VITVEKMYRTWFNTISQPRCDYIKQFLNEMLQAMVSVSDT